MQIDVKFKGMETVLKNLDKITGDVVKANNDGVRAVAIRLRDEATILSKAGHPSHPDVQSGRLSNSFRYQMKEGQKAEAYVGSDVDYAIYVEFGHMSLSWGHEPWHWVPEYPFFRPAIVNVFDGGIAQTIFENVFKNSLMG